MLTFAESLRLASIRSLAVYLNYSYLYSIPQICFSQQTYLRSVPIRRWSPSELHVASTHRITCPNKPRGVISPHEVLEVKIPCAPAMQAMIHHKVLNPIGGVATALHPSQGRLGVDLGATARISTAHPTINGATARFRLQEVYSVQLSFRLCRYSLFYTLHGRAALGQWTIS